MKQFIMGFGTAVITLMTLAGAMAIVTNNGDGTWTFGYTVTTEQAVELKDALCHNGNYQKIIMDEETLEMIPNPQSCQEFAWERGETFFIQEVKAYRRYLAEEAIDIDSEVQVD